MKKQLCILLFFISSLAAHAQISKGLDTLNLIQLVDTLFIDHDINNYSLRLFTNYKLKRFRIANDEFKSRYVPNNRFGIGFGFASSKLLVDIAFNIKDKNKDVTNRFDMQGTTILGKKNYVNFYVQTYKGFKVKNNFDEDFVFRDDIKSVTVGLNMLRTLPDIEFSYTLLKAGIDRLDKRFYLTGGFGAFMFYDYFSADDNVLNEETYPYFNDQAQIKRYNSAALGVLGGILSVFKLPENITLTCNLMPGMGLMYKHVTLEDDKYTPSNNFLFKMDYAVALGYNVDRYYLSLIYGGGVYSTKLGYDNNYRFNVTKAKLAFGYKLGTRSKKK